MSAPAWACFKVLFSLLPHHTYNNKGTRNPTSTEAMWPLKESCPSHMSFASTYLYGCFFQFYLRVSSREPHLCFLYFCFLFKMSLLVGWEGGKPPPTLVTYYHLSLVYYGTSPKAWKPRRMQETGGENSLEKEEEEDTAKGRRAFAFGCIL